MVVCKFSKLLLFSFLCLVVQINAMDGSRQGDAQMVMIKSWEDIKPYAGKFVVYESNVWDVNSFYCVKLTTKDVFFGFVSREIHNWSRYECGASNNEIGFNIQRLIKSTVSSQDCPLTNAIIKSGYFKLRLATLNELSQVYEAVKSGCANFEYLDQQDSLDLLVKVGRPLLIKTPN